MDTSGPKLNLLKAAGFHFKRHASCEQKPFNVGFAIKCQISALGLVHCQTHSQSEQSEGFMCLCPSVRTIILSSEQMNYSQALAQY